MKTEPTSVPDTMASGCLGMSLGALVFGAIGLIIGAVTQGFWVGLLIGCGSAILGAVLGWFFGLWMEK